MKIWAGFVQKVPSQGFLQNPGVELYPASYQAQGQSYQCLPEKEACLLGTFSFHWLPHFLSLSRHGGGLHGWANPQKHMQQDTCLWRPVCTQDVLCIGILAEDLGGTERVSFAEMLHT